MELRFRWNGKKAQSNLLRHGVAFQEAQTVFGDPLIYTFPDETHSEAEERLTSIGLSHTGRLLMIVHTEEETEDGFLIRLISCRKATAQEREVYEHGER